MSDPSSTPNNCGGTFLELLSCGSGIAGQGEQSTSILQILGALGGGLASFGIQLGIFLLLRIQLSRIYRPKSYLVPERERIAQPPPGLYQWIAPIFTTTNHSLVQQCGLDAYFFLRFLRALLKLFLPVSIITLPILLPINHASGDGSKSGLNLLSISNVSPPYTSSRLWAHLVVAIGIVLWFCYIMYDEMRGYIRVRQAYLTSPQHRIRASATTVLVSGIPRKWLSLEALSGLYDVFPGGIKNIWINRNYDELAQKVQQRDKIARGLEDAETALLKLCQKKHAKAEKAKAKKAGAKQKSKEEVERDAVEDVALEQGISTGEEHNIAQSTGDVLHVGEDTGVHPSQQSKNRRGLLKPLEAAGHGLGTVGKGVTGLGRRVVGEVDHGIVNVGKGLDYATTAANNGTGFVDDDDLYNPPTTSRTDESSLRPTSAVAASGQTPLSQISSTSDQSRPDTLKGEQGLQAQVDAGRTSSADLVHPATFKIDTKSSEQPQPKLWEFWKHHDQALYLSSPQPLHQDEDEFPFGPSRVPTVDAHGAQDQTGKKGPTVLERFMFWKKQPDSDDVPEQYPTSFNEDFDEDQDGEPLWKSYIEVKDRQTMRLPAFNQSWMPALPLIGKKVDRIYWLRRELSRLNLEIEADQNNIHKYPYMTSAFIQFNHQIAAHMACQAVSHHFPQAMAPRTLEISPNDVVWNNLSIRWWERYIRTGIMLAICIALIVFYAVPVGFTGLLANFPALARTFPALAPLTRLGNVPSAIITGLLPPILLGLILTLVPIIFRFMVKQQGVPTGNVMELGVSSWYFAFLFIQVFLVVTISGGIASILQALASNPTNVVQDLARSLPNAANYFFSYLLVQALSNSASAVLQVGTLVGWFIFAPLFDSTPRAKWRRQTNLSNVQWGSFFPPFANFAVIGIVYSAIAPLILVFMLIIFALFWVVYRYNVLYVYQFRNDTGGLLFPTAINQLFTGVYVMELCLIGFFFISQDASGSASCIPQAVIMIVVLIATVFFQTQLNMTFNPLLRFLPITLEDEAVIRDQEFERAQESRFAPLAATADEAELSEDVKREQGDTEEGDDVSGDQPSHLPNSVQSPAEDDKGQGEKPGWKTRRRRDIAPQALSRLKKLAEGGGFPRRQRLEANDGVQRTDVEAQRTVGDVLFSDFADELEDLTPPERDLLVQYAFQHSALRARRPVVWIPRDRLGISDDEIRRAKKMSSVNSEGEKGGKSQKTYIWMSNDGTALDAKGHVVFRRSPPDFSNIDLISL